MTTILKDDFYTVSNITQTENQIKATIHINAAQAVFKGHFPQMPVVPGVCQVQIIKELLEENTGASTMIISGDNIKFTGMILPDKHPIVHAEINFTKTANIYIVDAKLFFEDIIFTKFKGKFNTLN